MIPLDLPKPYLLFLGDVREPGYAKTALGLRDWAPQLCVGQQSLPEATVSTGLAELSATEAYARGARALVIGAAPVGGAIPAHWVPALVAAMEAGLDLVSGMHTRLGTIAELADVASRTGRQLWDVRVAPPGIPIANGRRRSGKRLLTVGTDCALGKKYTALALTRAFLERQVPASFRATGQTGIMIAGAGIAIDSVVVDFAAGAAEILSPDAQAEHWDVIEGQGSLFHPAYAAVSLALLHGSQPDVLILCHEAGRQTLLGFPHYRIPSIDEAIGLHVSLARRVNPSVRCAAVSLNTAHFSDAAAREAIEAMREDTGLPCADPLRHPAEFAQVVDACLAGC